jgi:hypothetical protein
MLEKFHTPGKGPRKGVFDGQNIPQIHGPSTSNSIEQGIPSHHEADTVPPSYSPFSNNGSPPVKPSVGGKTVLNRDIYRRNRRERGGTNYFFNGFLALVLAAAAGEAVLAFRYNLFPQSLSSKELAFMQWQEKMYWKFEDWYYGNHNQKHLPLIRPTSPEEVMQEIAYLAENTTELDYRAENVVPTIHVFSLSGQEDYNTPTHNPTYGLPLLIPRNILPQDYERFEI